MSDTVGIRNRIVALHRIRAGDLVPDENNWRRHSDKQRRSLRFMLETVGLAGAVLARKLEDGRFKLIDGHLRADMGDDLVLNVLECDVNEREAAELLATIDPIGAMADTDGEALNRQLAMFDSAGNPAVEQFLDGVRAVMGVADGTGHFDATKLDDAVELGEIKQTYLMYVSFGSKEMLEEAIELLSGNKRTLPEGATMASLDGEKWMERWRGLVTPAAVAVPEPTVEGAVVHPSDCLCKACADAEAPAADTGKKKRRPLPPLPVGSVAVG